MEFRTIPDEILESFTCRTCYKYLTVGPIEVLRDGGSICGRCSHARNFKNVLAIFECSKPEEFSIPIPLLGYVTYSQSLFPCINRFEGCEEFLPYGKIKTHETNCTFRSEIKCSLCTFRGVGSQLLQHFKMFHSQCFLYPNKDFSINTRCDSLQTYLYRTFNFLFLLTVQFVKDLNLCLMKTLYVGSTKRLNANIQLELYYPSSYFSDNLVLVTCPFPLVKNQTVELNVRIDNAHLTDIKRLTCKYNVIIR